MLGVTASSLALVRPLQPNQSPPDARKAESMAIAKPPTEPFASSTGATRLDTTMSRPIKFPNSNGSGAPTSAATQRPPYVLRRRGERPPYVPCCDATTRILLAPGWSKFRCRIWHLNLALAFDAGASHILHCGMHVP